MLAAALAACSSEPPPRPPAPPPTGADAGPAKPADGSWSSGWGKFHSKRFNVTLNLPDGKGWKIDDHHDPDMVAVHAATSSRLTVRATTEEGLMNRRRCEERARALGVLPDAAEKVFTTLEDEVWIGPEAYDSRVWVTIEAGRPGGAVVGHVFLFGSFVRRCLLVHLATSVPSANDEERLALRLAVAKEKVVKAIALDAPRTTEDAEIPRDRPR